MDVKYQIFISSTREDLIEERRVVTEAILNLGHMPVGMELFQAGNEDQWSHIKRRISECDYYLVIVAERYGSEVSGKSYTQMEYEYAIEKGVPVAGFLLDSTTRKSWPSDRSEPKKKAKIEAFRRICQTKLVKFWSSPHELASKVVMALFELTREAPRPGWVRGDSVPSQRVLEELSALSEEKRILQSRLDALQIEDPDYIPAESRAHLEQLDEIMLIQVFPGVIGDTGQWSLLQVYITLHKALAIGGTLPSIYAAMKPLRVGNGGLNNTEKLLAEYAALHLVSFVMGGGANANNLGSKQYFLTEYGKKFVSYAGTWLFQKKTIALSLTSDDPTPPL